jgi:uncharacterized protein
MLKIFNCLLIIILFDSCMANTEKSNQKIYALRLKPNQDLKSEILAFAQKNKIEAGYIITCVGSLKKANLRLANQPKTVSFDEKFEIVSLVGTFSQHAGGHFHIAMADKTGKTIGGHLVEGNIIYTTAEIVIGEITDYKFSRKLDPQTTYDELFIEKK